MIVINLPQFPFRGERAPYLWMFYKFLSSTHGDRHFFIHSDYLANPDDYRLVARWEFDENAMRKLKYEIPSKEELSQVSYSSMPDPIFDRLLVSSGSNPVQAFNTVLSKEVPELISYYSNELQNLGNNGKIDAVLSPVNCPSLARAAREKGIPAIYFELGPLRSPGYVDLAYFDFQGLNEHSEFPARYRNYRQVAEPRKRETFSEIRSSVLDGSWAEEEALERQPQFDVGVALQIEDDTNLIASSNGFSNQALIVYARNNFTGKKIAYKAHPGSLFSVKSEKGGVERSTGTQFLFDCKSILTINSSMGFEALLWGKPVYLLGRAAYETIVPVEDTDERHHALTFYLQNYLVPYDLIFDKQYIAFRLARPSEGDIREKHSMVLDQVKKRLRSEITVAQSIFDRDDTKNARLGADLEQVVASLRNDIESVVVDRDAHKAAAGELQQRVIDLARTNQEQVEGLNRVIAERDKVVSTLGQTVESLMVDRDAHKAAAGELQQRVIDLARTNQEQVEGLNRVIAMKESSLNAIYESKSWRITAPLRHMVRLLSNLRSSRSDAATNVANSESHQVTSSPVPSDPVADMPMSSAQGNAEGEKTYRILLVSYYYPTRSHAGGLRILDIYTLIKQRCPDVQLDLLTHHRPSIDGSIADSQRIFDNIYMSPAEDLSPSCLQGKADIRYDVVDLQFHQAAYHLEGYRRIASKVIFTPMESLAKVLYLEMRSQIKTLHRISLKGLLAQFKTAYEEISFCRNADYVVCVSRTDAAFIRAVGGGRKVHAIETGISPLEFPEAWAEEFTRDPASMHSRQIIYVAYFGSQTNVNALRWYLQEVHPRIAKAVPDYKLVVVGRGDLSSFEPYRGPQVELVGEVPTLAPYIKSAKLGIAPALGGSGFRGKVNQYAVLGIPAVVSSIALQGLAYRDGESVFIADDPQEFSDRCICLLTDDELNERIAHEARKLCMKRYSWESKWPKISDAYGLKEHVSC